MIVLLLILIPIFTMGISVFSVSLYDIAFGEYSIKLILFSSLAIILCGFLLIRVLFKFFDVKSSAGYNLKKNLYILSYYVIYILLFLLSIFFSIKVFKDTSTMLEKYSSLVLVFIASYFVFVYFLFYRKVFFEVTKITKVKKDVYKIDFTNKEYGDTFVFTNDESKYEVGKRMKIKINTLTKVIVKLK